jgi:hypothetical protein
MKRHAGALLAGLTLSIAILAALLPGWVEAQEADTSGVSLETAQDTDNDQTKTTDGGITAAMAEQGAYAPPVVTRTVNPGDSLWAIAQERLGPETTHQQVAEETGRIYGLNQERIGPDPNRILPGQVLLLTQRPEPAADPSPTTGGATEPAEEPAGEEPAAVEQPTVADEAVPDPTQDESAAEDNDPSYPLPYYSGQWESDTLTLLISLGLFLGALAIAAVAVAKLHRRRRLLGGRYYESSHEPSFRQEHDQPRQPEREADKKKPVPGVPGSTTRLRKISENSVWISCPYGEKLARSVEEALEAKARVYSGQEPPKGKTLSAVLLCPNGEEFVSEMKRIRALAPDAPVLVFCHSTEPRLVTKALQMGVSGFVHAGMSPERIALALTSAFEGEVLIPRELLGELLGQRLFLQQEPIVLDSHEREFLELVAISATFEDEVAVPKELLEAFLAKN